jgi:NAD+ synthase
MQTDNVIQHIVKELNAYCDKAGLKGFVVGVSGGIDSAVTSTLSAKTGKKTIVLNMPILQAKSQDSLSSRHIAWLEKIFPNVQGFRVDLSEAFLSLGRTLPSDIQDELSMANTRSRLRMLSLYTYATHHRLLVVGTGNKVEDFGVGFFTKYGDGGVDISPIADLLKTEVFLLGQALGIIEDIIHAPPTDGLWEDNRTDESQIGATYAELEWAMAAEAHGNTDNLTERQNEVLSIYRRFHVRNRHKMDPIPVIKIPHEFR